MPPGDPEHVITMHSKTLHIFDAHTEKYLPVVRTLFRAYRSSIDTNLCFQQFEEELAALPGAYAPPDGCLLLAAWSDKNAGCVALHKLDDGVCEMKRLFVAPEFQGQGIGIRLILEAIRRAREMSYQHMRLDTLPTMTKAIALYESLGFVDMASYGRNVVAGVRYMQLDLT